MGENLHARPDAGARPHPKESGTGGQDEGRKQNTPAA